MDPASPIWLLEWYLLLKHFASLEVLHQALAALFRLQRFDELGMTHTCCFIQEDGLSQTNFESPEDDEIYGIHADPRNESVEDDLEEIMDEEEEYIELLDTACRDFEKESGQSDERRWITILARLAVFIEEGVKRRMDRDSALKSFNVPLSPLEQVKVCR
jgi:hypothetical protein